MSVDARHRPEFDGRWHPVSVRCNPTWARDLAEPCFFVGVGSHAGFTLLSNNDIRWSPRCVSKTDMEEASGGQLPIDIVGRAGMSIEKDSRWGFDGP